MRALPLKCFLLYALIRFTCKFFVVPSNFGFISLTKPLGFLFRCMTLFHNNKTDEKDNCGNV